MWEVLLPVLRHARRLQLLRVWASFRPARHGYRVQASPGDWVMGRGTCRPSSPVPSAPSDCSQKTTTTPPRKPKTAKIAPTGYPGGFRRWRAETEEGRAYVRRWNRSEAHRKAQGEYRADGREAIAAKRYTSRPDVKEHRAAYYRGVHRSRRIQEARNHCRVIC